MFLRKKILVFYVFTDTVHRTLKNILTTLIVGVWVRVIFLFWFFHRELVVFVSLYLLVFGVILGVATVFTDMLTLMRVTLLLLYRIDWI